jgi:membrane AbrB-like protein
VIGAGSHQNGFGTDGAIKLRWLWRALSVRVSPKLVSWILLLALSVTLGWALNRAAVPAALLLGPMIAAIVLALSGVRLGVPRWGFMAAQAVVGCLIARSLTTSIVVSMVRHWPTMVAVVLVTILAGGLVGWVLVRLRALPGTTAAWGSSPGAASAMILMAEDFGADIRLVAFMQYLRIVIVVLSASIVSRLLVADVGAPSAARLSSFWVPWHSLAQTVAIAAIGALIGRQLRIPAGPFLVPMIFGAVLQTTALVEIALPSWLLDIAYATTGWYVGLAFNREVIIYAFRAIPQMLLATLLLIALCGLSAVTLTLLLHTDPLSAYLATSPGGLDSVAIIAIASHADLPFVLALQTLRMFMVIVTGPAIAKLISRYG